MNVKTITLAAALIASMGSTAALAGDAYIGNQNMPKPVQVTSPRVAVDKLALVDEYQQNQNVASQATSQLQRAQVLAEAIEARKLGLNVGGEIGHIAPTPAQAEQIRHAGLRAVNTQYASK